MGIDTLEFISYGTMFEFSKNPDSLLAFMSNRQNVLRRFYNIEYYKSAISCQCFDPYWYNSGTETINHNDFYFLFNINPPNIEDLVNEINSFFTNIRIDIVKKIDNVHLLYKVNRNWDNTEGTRLYSISSNIQIPTGEMYTYDGDVSSCIFKVTLNSKYDAQAKRCLYYLFHHILRMTSLTELWNKTYPHYFDKVEKGEYLKQILDLNNKLIMVNPNDTTRILSYYFVGLSDLEVLDDIEIMNQVFRNLQNIGGAVKQSNIILYPNRFKKTGKYNYFDHHKPYELIIRAPYRDILVQHSEVCACRIECFPFEKFKTSIKSACSKAGHCYSVNTHARSFQPLDEYLEGRKKWIGEEKIEEIFRQDQIDVLKKLRPDL